MWSHHCRSSIITNVHCNSAESKKVYFSTTPALVVVCSSSQNRNSAFIYPEWIYLSKTSNWAQEVTSADSATWRKHCRCFHLIYHLDFHIFQHTVFFLTNSLAISSASSYEACDRGENLQQDKSMTFQNCSITAVRILDLFWREMPYHLRSFHGQSTESLYN